MGDPQAHTAAPRERMAGRRGRMAALRAPMAVPLGRMGVGALGGPMVVPLAPTVAPQGMAQVRKYLLLSVLCAAAGNEGCVGCYMRASDLQHHTQGAVLHVAATLAPAVRVAGVSEHLLPACGAVDPGIISKPRLTRHGGCAGALLCRWLRCCHRVWPSGWAHRVWWTHGRPHR
jgi:hypothetical protein